MIMFIDNKNKKRYCVSYLRSTMRIKLCECRQNKSNKLGSLVVKSYLFGCEIGHGCVSDMVGLQAQL